MPQAERGLPWTVAPRPLPNAPTRLSRRDPIESPLTVSPASGQARSGPAFPVRPDLTGSPDPSPASPGKAPSLPSADRSGFGRHRHDLGSPFRNSEPTRHEGPRPRGRDRGNGHGNRTMARINQPPLWETHRADEAVHPQATRAAPGPSLLVGGKQPRSHRRSRYPEDTDGTPPRKSKRSRSTTAPAAKPKGPAGAGSVAMLQTTIAGQITPARVCRSFKTKKAPGPTQPAYKVDPRTHRQKGCSRRAAVLAQGGDKPGVPGPPFPA